MSENVKHINLRKSPLPRTGRELDAVGGTITSVSGGFSSPAGGGGEPINISISQGEGIEVTGSETSYTISHADTSDALNTENTDTSVITNVQVDKFGHITGIESGNVTTELDGRYIRKDIPDTDHNHLTLADGVKVKNGANTDTLNVEKTATTSNLIVKELANTYDLNVEHVANTDTLNVEKTATTLNLIVKELADTYDLNVEHVATLFQTIVKDYISSSLFIPGFTGSGMKLYQALNGDWNLELDNLTVRKLFNVFELVIQKIRSINGALIISQANGTIESVTDTGDSWQLEFSEEYPVFMVGDLLRCQVFGGKNMKYYWVTVSSVAGSTVNVLKSEFEGVVPAVGDEVVQIGNISDSARQSVIYLSASENGRPVIDILSGVNSKSFAGKLKARFGCLDNITDTDFPADYQPSGYGLYSTNAFLKGIFVLRNGKEVETELAALNGEISLRVTKDEYNNAVTGSRNLFLDTKNVADPDIWNLNSAATSVSWEDGFKVCHVYGNWGRVWQSGRFKPGKTYTVTCWVKRDPSLETGVEPSRISLIRETYNGINELYVSMKDRSIIPTKWTRFVWTFETLDNYIDANLPRLEFYCEDYQNNNPGALIYGYMVVEGDKAASWSPAPEDVERTSKEYSDTQIRIAKGDIDLSITTKINNVQVGTRNYLSNSRIKEKPYGSAMYQVVEDPQMGTVIEYSRPEGGGDFQFAFEVYNRDELKNTDLVYYVIAKEIGDNGEFLFGGWIETSAFLNKSAASRIDLGGGWCQYWVTFKSTDVGVGSMGTFGINSIRGTWRFYAAGVLKGNKPASWSPAIEDMASKVELESGIQILKDSVATKVSQEIFDDLGRKVTETQSRVLQLDDKINLSTTAINDLTGRVQQSEVALKPDNIWIGLKDKIKVGGRNTFSYLNTILDVWGGGVLIRESAYKGFTFSPAGISSNLRLARVITENGYWTISFDLNANVASSMNIDFCDISVPAAFVNAGYNRFYATVEVTNYSSNVYNFIDISGLSPGTFLFSNVQVEKGNVPTAWTPNPDDVGTKQELLDTGIDITNRQIVATADTFKIRGNTGQEIAVFKIDIDGLPKLKAQYIDVKNLDASQINASQINASQIDASKIDASKIDASRIDASRINASLLNTDQLKVKLLEGATGSFKTLNCVNESGRIVGKLQFGSDGNMWFDGNIWHQSGINNNPRFYAANIWCRGNFSTYMNAIVQVNDGAAAYYINGPTNSSQWKGLESKISANGIGYHPIPLVLQEGNGVAFSPEIVLINSSVTRYYELLGLPGKKVTVINVNRNVPCNFFYNGNVITIQGGHLREFYNVKGFLNPTGSTTRVGYGWMVGADSGNAF